MEALAQGWFSEVNDQWPGQAMSLQVDEKLHDEKSKFQHVQVFKSKSWGNVLVLDKVIQVTEKDEIAYQEMITHLPLFSHPNPEHVLIVGGGDGGVIREVLKHPSVKTIHICEIDEMVIDVSKKYLPGVAVAWGDSRVTLIKDDASKFIQLPENENKFDVIISDTSDPVGPAEALFELPFYASMHKALKPGGIACTQAETLWNNLDLIKKLVKNSLTLFANAEYATTQVPTYPCGQIGFLLVSKAKEEVKKGKKRGRAPSPPSCAAPVRKNKNDEAKFRYYSAELHKAAFVLPAFAATAVEEAQEEGFAAKKAAEPAEEEEPKKKAKVAPKSKKGSKKGGRKKKDDDEDGDKDDDAEKEEDDKEKDGEKEKEKDKDDDAEKEEDDKEKDGEKEKEKAKDE